LQARVGVFGQQDGTGLQRRRAAQPRRANGPKQEAA
jgi:hypothetical protein